MYIFQQFSLIGYLIDEFTSRFIFNITTRPYIVNMCKMCQNCFSILMTDKGSHFNAHFCSRQYFMKDTAPKIIRWEAIELHYWPSVQTICNYGQPWFHGPWFVQEMKLVWMKFRQTSTNWRKLFLIWDRAQFQTFHCTISIIHFIVWSFNNS